MKENMYVNHELSTVSFQCKLIQKDFDDLNKRCNLLEQKLIYATWEGETKDKYRIACRLAYKYQDNIRFLYEQLKVHLDELLEDAEEFVTVSEQVKKLENC